MDQPPTAHTATGHTKQYVFVDEYNRHKRLKVMRACDGCRKRKIRCDGALQNGPWPCGACVRLKLKCVPPTLEQDDDLLTPDSATGSNHFTFQTANVPGAHESNGITSHPPTIHEWDTNTTPTLPINTSTGPTSAPVQQNVDPTAFTSQYYSQQLGPKLNASYTPDDTFTAHDSLTSAPLNRTPPGPTFVRSQTEASSSSGGDPQDVESTVRELSEQMGDLTIDITSVAGYIANQKKHLTETPAIEEAEVLLPPSVGTDSTVRIPPEMMPSDERALDYFGYFFDYIHPYVPVLNRQAFYEQWRTARHSISPLVLEGIFACVTRYLEEPIEVRRWLALAARHEESFKDIPRLSTIQAMIILMKAREFAPKRGYYYRSWMAVKYMTTMGFDLQLHNHLEQHRSGQGCNFSRTDCMIRTRIWQALFCLESMVGAPQGRTDFAVELESVDFDVAAPSPDVDPREYQLSRRSTYFIQVFGNIKQTNEMWQRMRRLKPDWALDPMFVRLNEVIANWLKNLPADMQIHYPDDDSPPWLGGDHHLAYTQSYHHLVVIMHHRPQLQTLLTKRDPDFQTHLDVCNESASKLCRLQEALLRDFGLHGLSFMQRGVNYNIYCILTCTMLHLATITNPDPVVNARARMYFTRHVRILEHCMPSATPEMQAQINALRSAFSQDISKPFELKPTLGLRSPTLENNPTPPSSAHSAPQSAVQSNPSWSNLQDTATSRTISPAGEYNQQPFDQTATQQGMPYTSSYVAPATYATANLQRVTSAPHTGYTLEPVVSHEQHTPVWDPSGIFNQWNTAFGAQAPPPPPPTDPRMLPSAAAQPLPQHQPGAGQQALYAHPVPSHGANLPPEPVPVVPTVTPVMWQDAFTTAYVSGHGHKRYREQHAEQATYPQYQKRRG